MPRQTRGRRRDPNSSLVDQPALRVALRSSRNWCSSWQWLRAWPAAADRYLPPQLGGALIRWTRRARRFPEVQRLGGPTPGVEPDFGWSGVFGTLGALGRPCAPPYGGNPYVQRPAVVRQLQRVQRARVSPPATTEVLDRPRPEASPRPPMHRRQPPSTALG